MKLGFIGTGIIVGAHIEGLKNVSDFTLVAASEINEEKAKDFSEKYHVPCYLDYKEMCEKEEIDAVVINLPHFLHCEVSCYCLERGIHVLCEKPMANTAEECEKMIVASKKSGAKLCIGHIQRCGIAVEIARDYVKCEKLGKLCQYIEVRNEPYFLPSRPKWFLDKKLSGGGIATNFGAHTLDKISYIIGDNIENIHAICDNFSGIGDIEGHAQIFLTANGIPCSVTLNGYDTYHSNQTTLIFTEGALRWNRTTEPLIYDKEKREFVKMELEKEYLYPFAYQLMEFAKLIRGEENNAPDGEYGKKIIAAIEEIYRKGIKK